MECAVLVETEADQMLLVHGSYHAVDRWYDKLIVTDRDTYTFDILAPTLHTAAGVTEMESEQVIAAHITTDFLDAVREGGETAGQRPVGTAGDAGAAGGAGRVGCALRQAVDAVTAAGRRVAENRRGAPTPIGTLNH
jgi:hypothetical protein